MEASGEAFAARSKGRNAGGGAAPGGWAQLRRCTYCD